MCKDYRYPTWTRTSRGHLCDRMCDYHMYTFKSYHINSYGKIGKTMFHVPSACPCYSSPYNECCCSTIHGITHWRRPICHSIWLTTTIALKNYSYFANHRPFWHIHMHIELEEASPSLAPKTQATSCGPFILITSLTAFSSNFVSDSKQCSSRAWSLQILTQSSL